MTRWDDQFERHSIFAALDDARKRLELAEQEVGEDVAQERDPLTHPA